MTNSEFEHLFAIWFEADRIDRKAKEMAREAAKNAAAASAALVEWMRDNQLSTAGVETHVVNLVDEEFPDTTDWSAFFEALGQRIVGMWDAGERRWKEDPAEAFALLQRRPSLGALRAIWKEDGEVPGIPRRTLTKLKVTRRRK